MLQLTEVPDLVFLWISQRPDWLYYMKIWTNYKMSTILLCLKGFLFLSTWSLLRRGAAKLSSIPIIFSMTLGGEREFRGGGTLFGHLFRLLGVN